MADQLTRFAPFFDDFDAEKKFHRILFRPGFAVQARELTQIQSILQNQIKNFGNHIFAEGSMVVPGQAKFDTNASWVKVTNNSFTDTEDALTNNFLGNILVGGTSGVKARVTTFLTKDSGDVVQLFVKYTAGSSTLPNQKTFLDGETLTVESTSITADTIVANSTGKGCLASINPGIYFTKGFFAACSSQTIVVDKDTNLTSARVGLTVNQTIVTPEDDETLLDNALGEPNYAAPGACRLKIDLILTKKDLNTIGVATDEEDFIELLRIRDGLLEKKVDISTYSVLNETLARRTFDESGDYTVRSFLLDVREFYNENDNRGLYNDSNFFYSSQAEAAQVARDRFGFVGSDSAITFSTGDANRPFGPGSSLSDFREAARAKLAFGVEPGKAYVRGFEIETIAPTYVDVDKARETQTLNNQVIRTNLGNYVRVSNIYGAPRVGTDANVGDSSFNLIELRDRYTVTPGSLAGSQIGSARAIFWRFAQGTPNTSDAVYNLFLFNIKMNEGRSFEEVKQLWQAPQGSFPTGFTADAEAIEEPFLGATISKPVGTSNVLITGKDVYWSTLDSQRLGIGNTLRVYKADGTYNHLFIKQSPTSNNNITVDSDTNSALTDLPISRVYTVLEDLSNANLLYTLPQGFAKTLDNVEYSVQKQYISSAINSGEVTLSSASVTDIFDSYNGTNYYFCLEDGTPLSVEISQVSFPSATQIKIDGLDDYDGQALIVIASIRKSDVTPKTKTKQIGNWASRVESASGVRDLNRLYLNQADVISIKEIRMSADFSSAPSVSDTDITDRYLLDNGQRDMFYDMGSIVLKKDAQPPTGRIAVVFDWFQHSDEGTYFSVDSYIGIDYKDIPTYTNAETGFSQPLADVIDFRPTINSARNTFDIPNGSLSFVPSDAITLTEEFYLNRRDKIYLTPTGEFLVKKGVSAIKPSYPEDPANGMVLADIDIRAYTRAPKEVFLNYRDNKRYTMRDIGRIEKRVENLEYYTSLSLLEKETSDLSIKDSEGNDRFKNGFIVDSFTGHGIGDTLNLDYRCAVDSKRQELRPIFYETQVPVRECFGTNGFTDPTIILRSGANYKRINNLLMLDYNEIEAIKQYSASKSINVNPHDVTNFFGAIRLNPSNDEFKDTQQLAEPANVELPGNFDAINEITQGLGTMWGDWEDVPGSEVASQGPEETVSTINEEFPGPSFHLDQNGNPDTNWGNEALEQLKKVTNEPDTRRELHRLKKLDKQLKGERKSERNRQERRELDQRIKKIGDRIANTRESLPSATPAPNNWPIRTTSLTRTTTTVQKSQARQGIRLVTQPRTVTQSLGNKIVDVSLAEFARIRPVTFTGSLFKPNTRLYGFFDSVRVPLYQKRVLTGTVTFTQGSTAVTGVGTSFTTELAVGSILLLQNLQENFITSPNLAAIVTSITNNTNLILSAPFPVSGTGLCNGYNLSAFVTSDATGVCEGLFYVPRGIRTGIRQFRLVDTELNDDTAETQGNAIYNARGIVETKQESIVSTRVADVSLDRSPTDNRIVTDTKQDFAIKQSPWVDPVAQSFLVPGQDGFYVTSVDVFFETKDANIPVTVEVREMVNGYPGPKVIPGGRKVLYPADVHTNLITGAATPTAESTTDTTGTLTIDGVTNLTAFTSEDFVPTTFTFDNPIYLAGNTEYCIVVMANSIKYNVWISQLGSRNVGTRIPITSQPYSGVLFTSQNSSTWSADQSADLMFKINKAEFTTSPATILLSNQDRGLVSLPANPFKTKKGSNIVKVYHPNHGFRNKSTLGNKPRVRFSGITDEVGGIAANLFNNDFTNPDSYFEVNVIDLDQYYIILSQDATSTIYSAGGGSVKATSDLQCDALIPIITNISLPSTTLNLELKTTSGDGVHDGNVEPYVLDSSYQNFTSGQTIEFQTPRLICSDLNEWGDATVGPVINASLVSGSRSMFIRATMSTSNPDVTPIIDLERVSLISVANRVDDPVPAGIDAVCIDPVDYQTVSETALTGTLSNTGTTVTGSGTNFTTELHVGAYINVGNQTRKVVSITNNVSLIVDRAFNPALSGAAATTNTSTNITFGTSVVSVVTGTGLLTFENATRSVHLTGASSDSERNLINLLSLIKPGDLIKFSGSTSTGGRVIRNLVGPDSITMYFELDADIVDETPGSVTVNRVIDSIKCTDPTASLELSKLVRVGKYVNIKNSEKNSGTFKISGFTYSAPNFEMFIDYDVDDEVSETPITLSILDDFIDEETDQGGSAASVYVTKAVVLNNPSTALRLNFLGNIPNGSDVKVFYKISRSDENVPFDQIIYQEALYDKDVQNSMQKNEFKEYQLTIDKLPAFSTVAVKLVLLSNDSTKIPRVKDFAVIALDY